MSDVEIVMIYHQHKENFADIVEDLDKKRKSIAFLLRTFYLSSSEHEPCISRTEKENF